MHWGVIDAVHRFWFVAFAGRARRFQIRNPKHEIRNKFKIRDSNDQNEDTWLEREF